MKRISKKVRVWIGIVLLVAALVFSFFYHQVYTSNTAFNEDYKIVFVRESISVDDWIKEQAPGIIKNEGSFRQVAGWKKVDMLKPGRYKIKRAMSNNVILNKLRSGNQDALSIRIDDCENMYELAGKLGKYLQQDSATFATILTNPSVCEDYGFNPLTIACMIPPDTYDFFWNTTPQEFLSRMQGIHKKYWTEEKKQQAIARGMDPAKVCILASIVKAECSKKDEAPKIAGLYLNRLRIDMPLQADPTAVFASGLRNVSRVYSNMTAVDSPYNTYRNKGLPPGPIRFVEPVYLDAVLNPEKHSYIYMCAQPGSTGYHNFAVNYDQHLEYQKSYTSWLNKKGIH